MSYHNNSNNTSIYGDIPQNQQNNQAGYDVQQFGHNSYNNNEHFTPHEPTEEDDKDSIVPGSVNDQQLEKADQGGSVLKKVVAFGVVGAAVVLGVSAIEELEGDDQDEEHHHESEHNSERKKHHRDEEAARKKKHNEEKRRKQHEKKRHKKHEKHHDEDKEEHSTYLESFFS